MSMAIAEEVANYQSLRPMQKTKNVLVALIVFIAGIAIFGAAMMLVIAYSSDDMVMDVFPMDILITDLFIYASFSIFLSIFIYFNHNWAIILFLLLCLFSASQSLITQQFGITSVIISAISIWLSYRSFIVARDLKRAGAK